MNRTAKLSVSWSVILQSFNKFDDRDVFFLESIFYVSLFYVLHGCIVVTIYCDIVYVL